MEISRGQWLMFTGGIMLGLVVFSKIGLSGPASPQARAFDAITLLLSSLLLIGGYYLHRRSKR